MGYIGPSVVVRLKESEPEAKIVGLDTGYFAHCLTGCPVLPESRIEQQYFCDVRDVPEVVFEGVDSVVHLAAISNDPMGNRFEAPTEAINGRSTVEIARKAKRSGVKAFVFASSCSIYGTAFDGCRTEDSPLNPLTAYARSKISSERELQKLADDSFVVTSLRFATACGWSNRLRLDLVLNDFVASATALGKITILSDGTPWRPLIHIKDMALAIDWGVHRKSGNGGPFLAINAGRDDWNYQVQELASVVGDVIHGVAIDINKDGQPDKRSYRVSFAKFAALAPDYQPRYNLKSTIEELLNGFQGMGFDDRNFRESSLMRLKVLEGHIRTGLLDNDLRWVKGGNGQ